MTISSAGRDPFYKKTSTYKSVIGVLRIQIPIVQHRKAVTWNINAMKEESIKNKNLFIVGNNTLNLFFGANSFSDELVAVLVQHVLVLLDDAVHDGLSEHGLVDLVVTVTPVPHLQS